MTLSPLGEMEVPALGGGDLRRRRLELAAAVVGREMLEEEFVFGLAALAADMFLCGDASSRQGARAHREVRRGMLRSLGSVVMPAPEAFLGAMEVSARSFVDYARFVVSPRGPLEESLSAWKRARAESLLLPPDAAVVSRSFTPREFRPGAVAAVVRLVWLVGAADGWGNWKGAVRQEVHRELRLPGVWQTLIGAGVRSKVKDDVPVTFESPQQVAFVAESLEMLSPYMQKVAGGFGLRGLAAWGCLIDDEERATFWE